MTNIKLLTSQLKDELLCAIESSYSIYILTSFVMKSGVEVIIKSLKQAMERGAEIKICTGDYLYVTQPEALHLLVDELPNAEIHLWRSKGTSFHPKAYLFSNDENGQFIIGSSNLSRSALTTGTEWNLLVERKETDELFSEALDQFLKTMYHEQTIVINQETVTLYKQEYEDYHQKYPELIRQWTKQEEMDLMLPKHEKELESIQESSAEYEVLTPRLAQKEALEALQLTIEEGYDKAMAVMATGLGKTYLAAFLAEQYKRVLFIAHREEILNQTTASFQHVLPFRTMGIFNGKRKEIDTDCVFASIFTLSSKQNLEKFNANDFDLIVIDEFHHAAAASYERVIHYFKPSFLLGITATPDRLDGKDVYAICGGNVAYQMHFIEAIQKGWLAPFHYYGIYDDIDYSQIRWLGTRYDDEELQAWQLRESYANKIIEAWKKHAKTRTLAFCSSIKQADFLAHLFRKQNIQAISLHSKASVSRQEAISQLKEGQLQVIFTVDLFNEGVDIPEVDTLLFVRPTESLTIFTQQIGRGLRLHPNKESCMIIDLIGNYRYADTKLSVFQQNKKGQKSKSQVIEPSIPDNCQISLDLKVIKLLQELAKKKQPRKEKLREAYKELKQELGRRPTYVELHLKGKANVREYKQEFKSYVGFLYWANELSDFEKESFLHHELWLQEVEKTSMNKSYKMIVLLAMLQRGPKKWFQSITPEEVAPFFHHYLTEKEYRKRIDFSDQTGRTLWVYDKKKVSQLIARMPMTKWSGSSNGMIQFENRLFEIHLDLSEQEEEIMFQWTKEICEYRLEEYFARKESSTII